MYHVLQYILCNINGQTVAEVLAYLHVQISQISC